MLSRPPSAGDGKLPVFVFPSSLTFYTSDQTTHKQVLTLYNPYDFPLKFRVSSTAPKKYSVVDSEGNVKARCCVDLVVRHKDICINNERITDKFRISLTEPGVKKVIGRRDIPAVLYSSPDKGTPPPEDRFEQLPSTMTAQQEQQTMAFRNAAKQEGSGPSLFVLATAIVCILGLMLPTEGDKSSRLPDYLVLTVNQKLIAAYVLGLVTIVLLRV